MAEPCTCCRAAPSSPSTSITAAGRRGIVEAHYGSALSFRDPDNIALELFAPPR
jgi:hypothetical protein